MRERDHLGDPGVDGKIILRWIFRKWEGLWGLDGVGSGYGRGECGNVASCSIKCGEFIHYLKTG